MVKLLRVAETAEMLCVSRSEVYKLVAERRLGCVRVGTRILFSEQQIEAFVEASTVAMEVKP